MQLRGLCRRSWERIRVYVGGLGSGSGLTWAVLGADQGLPDGLGSGSGPTWAVLGVDQGLCGRSWERIRAKSGPGSSGKAIWAGIWVAKWPKPERESRSGEAIVFPRFRCPEPPVLFFL